MLENITVTGIADIKRVWSEKGRDFSMTCRSSYGISLCECGEIVYHHKGNDIVSDKAHAILLPQGSTYTLTGTSDGWFPLVNFYAAPDFSCDSFVLFPLADYERCIGIFKRLQTQSFVPRGRAGTMALLYQLFEQIELPDPKLTKPLTRAMDYLSSHLCDFSLCEADLSNAAGISAVWLRKLFSENYGISPKQMILQRRLQIAQRLLTEENISVTEVAEKSGFSDIYHFSRFFSERTGFTPTKYRKISREAQFL